MAINTTIQLNSPHVLVFPSTRRSDYQKSARYQQESTFTDTVNNLCDYNGGSFIITKPNENMESKCLSYDTGEAFEFYIHGYRFRLIALNQLLNYQQSNAAVFDDALQIYAYIDLDDLVVSETTEEHRYELKGRDEGSAYTGVKFSNFDPDPGPTHIDGRYKLLLFSRAKTTDNWANNVYINSLYKFSIWGTDIKIDGGIIA